jgi:hypothetical protein
MVLNYNVNSVLGLLYRGVVGDFADVSETNYANMEHVVDVSKLYAVIVVLPTFRIYMLPP